MKAKCDRCGGETDIRFIEANRPRGLKETYFRCNECNAHYTCFVTDKKVRRLQKEVDKLRGNGVNVEIMQKEINDRMTELKKEIEGRRRK